MQSHGWRRAGAGALLAASLMGCAGGRSARQEPRTTEPAQAAPAPSPAEQDEPVEASSPDPEPSPAAAVANAEARTGGEPEGEEGLSTETEVVEIDPALLLGPPPDAASSLEAGGGPVDEATAGADEAAQETPERAEPASGRADGRPSWWLDEPRTEGGAVTLCAEALARTVLEARRAAIRAGAAALERRLGEPARDMEVVAATVRPLRESAGAADMRFAGYVLVRAKTDDALAER